MATHDDRSLDHRPVDHIRAASPKQGKPYLLCAESHSRIAQDTGGAAKGRGAHRRPTPSATSCSAPDPLLVPGQEPTSQRSTIDPFPWKSTRGAARTAGFSTSKYSARWNPNTLATTFGGKVSTFVFNVRTFAL